MKCLTLIVHQTARQDLLDSLSSAPQVTGFTISKAEGHSERTGENPFDTVRDRVLGFVPRVRVDVLIEDDDVDAVLGRLRHCESCVVGRGIWWVTPVLDYGPL